MSKSKSRFMLLLLAPAFLFTAGCDQLVDDLGSGEAPPCLIIEGAECQPVPPPPPPPPHRFSN